jgi:thiol-disulfide isomerase/thioredoxin
MASHPDKHVIPFREWGCTGICKIGLGGALLCLLLLTGCGKKLPEGSVDFSLKSMEGQSISLSQYKGKVTLVVFWASWCPPCIKEIPDLIELQNKYKNKGLQVLSINLDEDEDRRIEVPKLQNRFSGWNYPILVGDGSAAKAFGGVQGIPTSFFVNQNGKVLDKLEGAVPKYLLESAIQVHLKASQG